MRSLTHHQIGDECAYGTLVRRTFDGAGWVVRRADGRFLDISAAELVRS